MSTSAQRPLPLETSAAPGIVKAGEVKPVIPEQPRAQGGNDQNAADSEIPALDHDRLDGGGATTCSDQHTRDASGNQGLLSPLQLNAATERVSTVTETREVEDQAKQDNEQRCLSGSAVQRFPSTDAFALPDSPGGEQLPDAKLSEPPKAALREKVARRAVEVPPARPK